MKGKLITLEGTEGSGKSRQAGLLCRYLEKFGYKVVLTTEPVNIYIRKLLLNPKNRFLDSTAELFLYLADRAQHVKEIIIPYLKKGYIVICDRFIDSTEAYQGYGRRLQLGLIERLNKLAAKGIKPDLTIILDVPLKLGLKRAKGSGGGDRMEREKLQFHRRVHNGYKQLAEKEPKRIRIVKVDGDIMYIQEKIRRIVQCHLGI